MRLRDQTPVLLTSDQGVAIGSHGLRGKRNLYDHTIRVPRLEAARLDG